MIYFPSVASDDDQVCATLFNALYILGMNQDQFKEKLTMEYGARDWPDYAPVAVELYTHSEAISRMNSFNRKNEEKVKTGAPTTRWFAGQSATCR